MKVFAIALLIALSAQLAAATAGIHKSLSGAKYDLLFQKIEDRAAGLLTALHTLRYHAQGLDASGSRKNPELDKYFQLVQAKVLNLYGSFYHLRGAGPVGGPK